MPEQCALFNRVGLRQQRHQADAVQYLSGWHVQPRGFKESGIKVDPYDWHTTGCVRLDRSRPAHQQRFANAAFKVRAFSGTIRILFRDMS